MIPYRADHPFNIACCPTKIMDYMAAGRPVVSTDLPECELYSDVFDVVEARDFLAAVAIVAWRRTGRRPSSRPGGNWPRRESCRNVASRLLDWID